MAAPANQQVIDDGTAPEVYVDDLGYIKILNGNVEWGCIRHVNGHLKVTLKVIAPIDNVPNVASLIVSTFGGQLTRRIVGKLRSLAGFAVMH